MNKQNNQNQHGQAMVIMVLGLVALLGMVALAIDGGRVYTERRTAQNAADASAMAAVRELGSGASSVTARTVAIKTAAQNNYDLDEGDITINNEEISYGSYSVSKTTAYLVKVNICSEVEATFAQFVFSDILDVCATSEMEVRLKSNPFAGFGIVSLSTSCSGNANGYSTGVSGGGNSGGVEVFGSSILSNAAGNNSCAFGPPSSSNPYGIYAYDCNPEPPSTEAPPYGDEYNCTVLDLYAVGNYTCTGGSNACDNLGDVEGNVNNGQPYPDPLANLPTPQCTSSGQKVEVDGQLIYYPGNWKDSDLGAGIYQPGIYCITAGNGAGFKVNGDVADASSGVLFYFSGANGTPTLSFSGSGELDLRAPGNGTDKSCDGVEISAETFSRTDPCSYQGMALFVQHGVPMDVDLRGNGLYNIYGTMYGDSAILAAGGGGNTGYEINIYGQIIFSQVLNDGGGSLKVYYNEDLAYTVPPYINALQ